MPRDVSILGITINTYTLLISAAILASVWIVMRSAKRWQVNRWQVSPSRIVNLCLSMLIGGLVLARVEHLILNWDYFSRQVTDLLQWIFPQRGEPGLGWHGAVIGALGVFFAYPLPHKAQLLDTFAIPLGLIALAAWVGCASQGCAYGAEVDTLARYSRLIVSETRDLYGILAPRYNTQLFGAGVSLVCVIGALICMRRSWFPRRRSG